MHGKGKWSLLNIGHFYDESQHNSILYLFAMRTSLRMAVSQYFG